MTHCLGGVHLASHGPCNVNISQLVAERAELRHRRGGWRWYKLVIAMVQGGLVLCNDLPALEEKMGWKIKGERCQTARHKYTVRGTESSALKKKPRLFRVNQSVYSTAIRQWAKTSLTQALNIWLYTKLHRSIFALLIHYI